jgi:phosphoribosylanthranilate isomerase
MTQVKICGINDPASFDTAVEAGADWIGFNFFPPSPRYVTPAQAQALSSRYKGGPVRVGLFVRPSIDEIAAILDAVPLDILQLYSADETLDRIHEHFGLPIWRALGVVTRSDLPTTLGTPARLLIEAKAPPGATRPGGNAQSLDWSILSNWAAPGPWMLAGGLTPDNVGTAIRTTGADALDVSSGVESSIGVKSPALIEAFIQAAKSPIS